MDAQTAASRSSTTSTRTFDFGDGSEVGVTGALRLLVGVAHQRLAMLFDVADLLAQDTFAQAIQRAVFRAQFGDGSVQFLGQRCRLRASLASFHPLVQPVGVVGVGADAADV